MQHVLSPTAVVKPVAVAKALQEGGGGGEKWWRARRGGGREDGLNTLNGLIGFFTLANSSIQPVVEMYG